MAVWPCCSGEKRRGGEGEACDVSYLDAVPHLPLFSCPCSVVVGYFVADGDVMPACYVKKGEGGGQGSHCTPGLMWTVMMTCVITVWTTYVPCHHPQPLSIVHWAGEVALPHCWCCWGWLNDGCVRWWLLAALVTQQRVVVTMGDGGG